MRILASSMTLALLALLAGCKSSSTSSSTTSTGTTTSTTTTAAGGSGQGGGGTGGAAQGGSGQGGSGMGGMGGMGGMAQGGAGQGGAGQAPTCDQYCADVMANCTAAFAQFPDEASCKAFCATWDAGDAAKHEGDTIACHDYHAAAPSKGSPDPHCYHAGPSGGGQCGATTCDDFCAAAVKLCTGNDQVWADEASCKTDCEGFGTSNQGFSTAATTGDTVECRLYHLTAAATEPATHCAHIAKDSPVCK
jgi:hypothetical protein